MAKITTRLVGQSQRERAKQLIDSAPDGYIATVGEETRSDRQNRLMWPLIQDIQRQVGGADAYTADDTKLRLMNLYQNEMRMLPVLEGQGHFMVGQRSSKLTKAQFGDLIETIYAYGARHGVNWSARSQVTFNEVKATA
jgi:NinB protein